MLGGHHDRVDAHQAVVVVGERDLCLPSGEASTIPCLRTSVGAWRAVGEQIGAGEVGRVGARVARHDALVAGPRRSRGSVLRTALRGTVDAACNVGALTVEETETPQESTVKAPREES